MQHLKNWAIAAAAVMALGFSGWGCGAAPAAADDGFGDLALEFAAPPPDPREQLADVVLPTEQSPYSGTEVGQTKQAESYEAYLGWAMNGTLQQRCVDGSGNPISPCQFHMEPSLSDQIDIARDAKRGSCGSPQFPNDNRAMPCAVPESGPNSRSWSWKIDRQSCLDLGVSSHNVDLLRAAAANTFSDLHVQMPNWSFPETSGSPRIPIDCRQSVDANGNTIGSLGSSTPAGTLRFNSAITAPGDSGILITDYTCTAEDANAVGAGRFGQIGVETVNSYDEFWTYSKGQVHLYLRNIADDLVSCGFLLSKDALVQNSFRSVLLHELGHVFGFQHMLDSNDATGPAQNIMSPGMSCAQLQNWQNWRIAMRYPMAQLEVGPPHATTPPGWTDWGGFCYFPDNATNITDQPGGH
jgi:hypothetical protein